MVGSCISCFPNCPFLVLLMVGFLIPVSVHFYIVSFLFLLFFPLIFIFAGWTVYHQTSERVTYKSSSKPRTRFLSGPVSLSICLYLFFYISPHSFPYSLYLICLSLLSNFILICMEYSGYFISPSLQVFSPDIHPLSVPTTHTSPQQP